MHDLLSDQFRMAYPEPVFVNTNYKWPTFTIDISMIEPIDVGNISESNVTTQRHLDSGYTDFPYQAFGFERVIYLYVWVILVVMTLIVNLFVSIVLTRKPLRSATNMLLVAIAITDSLTGLVNFPSYIMVYSSYQSAPDVDYTAPDVDPENEYNYNRSFELSKYFNRINHKLGIGQFEKQDTYLLSKPLCQAFMLSKFYFSMIFHTMSIWLTLYLGLQRFICVKFPFATQIWFTKKTHIIVCAGIVFLAPILHIFHVTNEKTNDGMCSWLIEKPCTGSCAHMMATLLLMHLIPCTVLTVTTALFVHHILHNRFDTGNDRRAEENRRVSKIVIAVVVVFLIPELPYALFLVYLQVLANTELRSSNDLKTNRVIHALYEVLTLLSFNANFYIFTFLNRRFRRELKTTLLCKSRRGDTLTSNTSRSRGSDIRIKQTGSETDSAIALKQFNNEPSGLEPKTSMAK